MGESRSDRAGEERVGETVAPAVLVPLAAVHLGVAGGVNLSTGAVLWYGGASGLLVLPVIESVAPYLSGEALLGYAGAVTRLVTTLGPILGAVAVAIGGYQLAGVRTLDGGTRTGRRRPAIAAATGLLNPLTLPLAVIALGMVALERRWRADGDR